MTFVEVALNGWDTHDDNFNRVKKLTETADPAWTALLSDLKERGMLDRTLVIWMGEFGRTPKINPKTGRDHYPPGVQRCAGRGRDQGRPRDWLHQRERHGRQGEAGHRSRSFLLLLSGAQNQPAQGKHEQPRPPHQADGQRRGCEGTVRVIIWRASRRQPDESCVKTLRMTSWRASRRKPDESSQVDAYLLGTTRRAYASPLAYNADYEWNLDEHTLAGKQIDLYDPPGKPRFGVLYLHGVGLETLVDNPIYTGWLEKLQLACVCPHGQRSGGRSRLHRVRSEARSRTVSLADVMPFFAQRWGLAPRAVGLMGVSMGGQGA